MNSSTEISQSELAALCAYSRLPKRLRDMLGEQRIDEVADEFGVEDRLAAIRSVLNDTPLNSVVDLGGNSGFYCLSFADSGMLTRSTVFDLDGKALDAGRKMARSMGLEEKVTFEERCVDLEFVESLPPVDTIICLNLIHHAGVLFDEAVVAEIGWEEYARRWLSAFREKSRLLILGVGLKGMKPVHWNIPPLQRAARIIALAKELGWSTIYDANVHDIGRMGIDAANGARTRGSQGKQQAAGLLRRVPVIKNLMPTAGGKTQKYHLYIMKAG